jgi:hypothetical protein
LALTGIALIVMTGIAIVVLDRRQFGGEVA